MAYTVGAISLGCNKNRVDTESALGLLKENGYSFTPDPSKADILLVNTCGFIDPAKEESINTILEMAEYKETGRCRLLVVTGCLAQRYENDLLKEIPEIDLLLGVNQYRALPEMIEKALTGQRLHACQDDHSYFEQKRVLTTPSYSAYVRIGEGCSNHCTFCAIPLIRGPYRSRSKNAILRETQDLVSQGVKELILVAQDTTRWGTDMDGKSRLPELMREVSAIPGVEWLRVLYCYPDETSEELLDLLANSPNICSYLDIPIQHINSQVLRRMHRLGTREDILRCVEGAKKRGLTLRTTVMTGFPGETDEQFQELLNLVKEVEFDRLGAFAYSPEEGTPAARMPSQLPEEVKQERLDQIMTAQNAISLKRNLLRVGSVEKVLVTDLREDGIGLGRSSREAPETDGEILFRYHGSTPEIGSFIQVRITNAEPYDLLGEKQ